MRFDDRIATLLGWEARAAGDRGRIWRQLADLLGDAPDLDEALAAAAVARLVETEQDVPLADRRRAVAGFDLAWAAPAFLEYLARDPATYGALLPARRIAADIDWSDAEDEPFDLPWDDEDEEGDVLLLGTEDAPSRDWEEEPLLDLDPIDADPAPPAASSQISDLLARIDAFQARREAPVADVGFAFEIDAEGVLRAREDGLLLAHCAEPPQGVDAGVTGAWRLGAPFVDARLIVEDGPHAGEWRISADPIRSEGGRTIGYRGTARAPRADETAVMRPPADGQSSAVGASAVKPGATASRLADAIDRLREPLAALFAAADPDALPPGQVRDAAGEVRSRSAALTAAIETLELAVAAVGEGGLDAAALLVRIDAALQPLAEARGLKVSFRLARGLPPVDADPQAVERMVARLVGAVVSLGRRNEQIVTRLGRDRADGRMLALSITRPGRFTGWPGQALLDPPPAPQDADAPELGLSFALRLVDRLAQEAGGRLAIHADRIVLSLPLPADPRKLPAREAEA